MLAGTKSRNVLVGDICLIVAVLVAGCGGGDDTTALTKAQFIKQADAICRQADEAQIKGLVRVEKEVGGLRTKAQRTQMMIKGGLPAIQSEAEEVAALDAPEGDEEEVQAIVTAIEDGVSKAEGDPLGEVEKYFASADKLARSYGLKDCSEAL